MILRLYNSRETIDNQEAIDFAVGCLLGDGSIKASETRLVIEQSIKDYTQWKLDKMISYGLSNNVNIGVVEHKKTNTIGYRFYTKSLFKDFHKFYVKKDQNDSTFNPNKPQRRKCFLPWVKEVFKSSLTLAVFYMDDGGIQDNQPYLSTGEVPYNEVLLFQQALKENFGLSTSIRTNKNVPQGLLLSRKDCGKFLDLVEKHVLEVPCMHYKLQITRP